MASVQFIYQQVPTIIQVNEGDSFKHVAEKFAQKAKVALQTVYFIGNGRIIQENAVIKDLLKESNSVSLLVKSYNEEEEGIVYVDSKEVICPECNGPCRFKVENYQIELSNCKNGHLIKDIKLGEFQNKQKINYTNIICQICKEKNKGEATDHKFNYCLNCDKDLCILCAYKHDKSHKIIEHDKKNYTCLKHNELYSKYCLDCNKNICISCEDEHGNHDTESFSSIIPDINKIKKNQKELNDSINLLNQKMKQITDELTGNLEALYKINDNVIKSFESQNRNYEILKNVNEINYHDQIIIDDINSIVNNNKLINIIQMYNKIKGFQNIETIYTKEGQSKNQNIILYQKII